MTETKQDLPDRKRITDSIKQPPSTTPPTTLNSGSMFACGDYTPPLIVRVRVEVLKNDGSGPALSPLGTGPGGTLKDATLDSVKKVWTVQFTNIKDNTDSAHPYRLKAHFLESGDIENSVQTVFILLSSEEPVHMPTCDS